MTVVSDMDGHGCLIQDSWTYPFFLAKGSFLHIIDEFCGIWLEYTVLQLKNNSMCRCE